MFVRGVSSIRVSWRYLMSRKVQVDSRAVVAPERSSSRLLFLRSRMGDGVPRPSKARRSFRGSVLKGVVQEICANPKGLLRLLPS